MSAVSTDWEGGNTHLLVLTTVGDKEAAQTLVKGLIEERLAACGTMVDAASIYRWDGKIAQEGEILILLKTHRDRWEDLKAAIQKSHPYDVPELLALPVQAGLDAYLHWVRTETTLEGEKHR
ncbi:MAG: divalent-cation tolerance protein CutA [Gemmatimonadota bacterium]|nr:divalent-cation tolerance protein CutA [Gemmatimonadota bacterium]MDH5805774.1 divalent-cation tolerance protein CutA [Gemmatimonadota bacterium]